MAEPLGDVLVYRHKAGSWPGHSAGNDPDAASLASWIAAQRNRRRRGVLKPEREAAMLAAGFDFDPSTRRRLKHRPPELAAQIVDEYRRGASVSEIAHAYSIGRPTVRSILQASGVPIRAAGQLPIETSVLLELRGRGLSHAKIAAEVGLKANTVSGPAAPRRRLREARPAPLIRGVPLVSPIPCGSIPRSSKHHARAKSRTYKFQP